LFRTYIANVSSRYCKVDLGVAHGAVGPICSSRLLQLLGSPNMRVGVEERHGAGVEREATRNSYKAGVDVWTLPLSGRPDAGRSDSHTRRHAGALINGRWLILFLCNEVK